MRPIRTAAGIGALLTCPCHVVPLLLLLGGTAGSVWIARHLPALMVASAIVFVISLWLLLRPERRNGSNVGGTAAPPGERDVLRRS